MMDWILNQPELREFGDDCVRLLVAVLGTVAGLGEYALAAASGLVSLVVLAVLRPLTKAFGRNSDKEGPAP